MLDRQRTLVLRELFTQVLTCINSNNRTPIVHTSNNLKTRISPQLASATGNRSNSSNQVHVLAYLKVRTIFRVATLARQARACRFDQELPVLQASSKTGPVDQLAAAKASKIEWVAAPTRKATPSSSKSRAKASSNSTFRKRPTPATCATTWEGEDWRQVACTTRHPFLSKNDSMSAWAKTSENVCRYDFDDF